MLFESLSLLGLVGVCLASTDPQIGGGFCRQNTDCGFNGVVLGGYCENSQCVCYPGFTCDHCTATARGDGSCLRSAGGGSCQTHADCNLKGSCSNGICVCFEDYSCPQCDVNNRICTRDPNRDGGYPCAYDIECGIASANTQTLRLEAVGLGGRCFNGTCKCDEGFGCKKCNVQLDGDGSSERAYRTSQGGSVDVCTLNWGGGRCTSDFQCNHGLCLNGGCVCYFGWTCPYCTHDVNAEILRGATCSALQTGMGYCATDSDCTPGHSICVEHRCICDTPYTCRDCSLTLVDVLANLNNPANSSGVCDCGDLECVHGNCGRGLCNCERGYTGIDCSIASCGLCYGHGTCNSYGKCDCQAGYLGYDCGTGGGVCTANEDCGYNGNVNGGQCVNGHCRCYKGFTCEFCQAKGEACSTASGGAKCRVSSDCGIGQCNNGWCVCDPDYTCPACSQRASACTQLVGIPRDGTTDPPDADNRTLCELAGNCQNETSSDSKASDILKHPAVIIGEVVAGIVVCYGLFTLWRRRRQGEHRVGRDKAANAAGRSTVGQIVVPTKGVTKHLMQTSGMVPAMNSVPIGPAPIYPGSPPTDPQQIYATPPPQMYPGSPTRPPQMYPGSPTMGTPTVLQAPVPTQYHMQGFYQPPKSSYQQRVVYSSNKK